MLIHIGSFHILQEVEPSLTVVMVGRDVEFASDENLVREKRKVNAIPMLDTSYKKTLILILQIPLILLTCWWQLEGPFHRDMLVGPVVEVITSLQGPKQIHKLKFIEPLVYIRVVVKRELKLVNVVPGDGQVFILPRVIDDSQYAFWYTDFGKDQEQSLGSFQYPLHVCVIGESLTEGERLVQITSFLASQLRYNEPSCDFSVDLVVCPPELFQRCVWRD